MKKSSIVSIIGIIVITIVLIILFVMKNNYSEDSAMNELLSLNTTSSIETLKEKGYIDVSQTMKSDNKKINSFLKDVKNKNKSSLKIVTILEGRLCAKVLFYNKQSDSIVMYSLYPDKQQLVSPNKHFSTKPILKQDENKVDVYLKNIQDKYLPVEQDLIDEKLYSYIEN